MREFRVHELANYVDWWPDLVIHEGPFWENGYLTIQDKPGYGVELNPDVAQGASGARRNLVGIGSAAWVNETDRNQGRGAQCRSVSRYADRRPDFRQ